MKKSNQKDSNKEVIEYLKGTIDRQMSMVRAYQARQDDIVRSLGAIQRLIGLGALEAVETSIKELMATDLKQARERVYNQDAALRIAIEALKESRDRKLKPIEDGSGPKDATPIESGLFWYFGKTNMESRNAIEKIKALAPEAFEDTPINPGKSS